MKIIRSSSKCGWKTKILLEGTTSEEEQSRSIRQEGRKRESLAKFGVEKQKRREEQRCREQGKMHLNYQKINKLENEKLKN